MARVLRLGAHDRILVLAPHPDDETIATGGLLQYARARGAAVRVVFATDGENNPWAQRAVEHRWRIQDVDRARFGARRRREALAALARLGVAARDTEFLGCRDQGLTALLMSSGEAPHARLAQCIAAFRPTTVVAPSPADLHPDHSALGVLVDFALVWLAPHEPAVRVVHYVVHDLPPSSPADRPMQATRARLIVPLAHRERVRKRRAMFAHGTQLVLRRRMLLTRAADPEIFVVASETARGESDGSRFPATSVDATDADGRLWLSLRRSVRLGACGATTLLLAVAGVHGRRLYGRLGHRSGVVRLRDVVGAASDASVIVRAAPHRVELGIPAPLFAGARRAYLKLERRFGFFDEAGWHPIALQLARGRTAESIREDDGVRRVAAARDARSVDRDARGDRLS
jgi:LmbE family N-acetylglucosaminyl deacetylase